MQHRCQPSPDEDRMPCVNNCGRLWGYGAQGDLCAPCARREDELVNDGHAATFNA